MKNYTPGNTDIAVIGMAGRFPGAASIGQYWNNLCDGVESAVPLSADDLRQAGIPDDLASDPDYVRVCYPLQNADCFDASFFGYNPREARFIDPQQRVLLETAWNALEDAGYADGKPRTVGVYVGSSLNTYLLFSGVAEKFKTEPVLTLMSNDKDFLATRISYKLQLEGPAVTVQTACSTSLVAVHQACQSILARECDMALAGGVCVKVPLKAGYLYREGGMLSKDGHCRAFDADATGTIFGSGAGIVVLKRYSEALRDGDRIDAIIRASAINNDGARKASYTAPSVTGIAEVIQQSMDFAGVNAGDVDYVECHGTGTALGDPIEVHAMTKAFRQSTGRSGYCAIGSVKTNIGHLEAASGIASFIKVVCSLRYGFLPRTLHFRNPNPALALNGSPFHVACCAREWPLTEGLHLAAVNSMGVGGTNANVILQQAPPAPVVRSRRRWHLLPVSARSAAGVDSARNQLASHLDLFPGSPLADAAFTLSAGRTNFEYRDVLLSDDRSRAVCEPPIRSGPALRARQIPVVFLFGDDFDPAVADALACDEPDFADLLSQTRSKLQPCACQTLVSQIALAACWQQLGLTPQATLSDGIGNVAAALADNPDMAAREISSASAPPVQVDESCRDFLGRHPNAIFVPIGSSSTLVSVLSANAKPASHLVLPPLKRRTPSSQQPSEFLEQAAALWKLGVNLNLSALYANENRTRVGLPVTAFEQKRHWF